jgi:hypothetical protein
MTRLVSVRHAKVSLLERSKNARRSAAEQLRELNQGLQNHN